MNKKHIISTLICLMAMLMISCQKVGKETGDNYMNNHLLVTTEEFKEFYNMDNSEISDDIIEGFILEYNIKPDDMKKEDLLELLNGIVITGRADTLGYDLSRLFDKGTITDASLNDFLKDAKMIYIQMYGMYDPDAGEFASRRENLVIDLKYNKIYFNSSYDDYRQSLLSADLNEACLKKLQDELPNCLQEHVEGESSCLDYSYSVSIIDNRKNKKVYDGCVDNQLNIQFDNLWKSIYLESFGKEYERSF